MNRKQIEEAILEIFKKNVQIDDSTEIDVTASIVEAYKVNSIMLIRMLVDIEEYFDLELDDNELELSNYYSIETIVDMIQKYLQ